MKNQASQNEWVTIELTLLLPNERSKNIPEDTSKHPYRAFIQGFLKEETATVGDEVTVTTLIQREHQGHLLSISPAFIHGFGQPVPELLPIGNELRNLLSDKSGETNEY